MARLNEIQADKQPAEFHGQCKRDLVCAQCGSAICEHCAERRSPQTVVCPACRWQRCC